MKISKTTDLTQTGYSFYSLIEKQIGEQFYLFHRNRFLENIQTIKSAFKHYYPYLELAHSYKTNYTPTLCRIAKEQGLYAEVVSGMEYRMARRMGYSPVEIIFNGPIKSGEELRDALFGGSMVNVDHLAEVDEICKIARSHRNHRISVGIRCNADYGASVRSRFGMDDDSGELAEAFSRFSGEGNIDVVGIHIHTSAIRSPESYRKRAEFAVEVVRRFFTEKRPHYINLGGGFPSLMPDELLDQLGAGQTDYDRFAAAVCEPLVRAFGTDGTSPRLFLEPGLALFANVFSLCTKVLALKHVGGRAIAVLSGGMHTIKPTGHGLNMPVTHLRSSQDAGKEKCWDLTGYTCMEHDVLYEGFEGAVGIGDYFIFEQLGAYTTVFKPPFILPAPPIVEIKDGGIHLLRRRETLDQLWASYEEKRK